MSAERFVKDLKSLTANTIHLRINSPGGDVFEGRAIATAVRQHSARIISHVDGMALSAASWIALAGDEVEIADGSYFMIHRAWALAMGNAEDLMDMAELLEKVDQDLVREYVAETGQTEDQIREWLDAETWFNADEAVEYGFADRKAESFEAAKNSWDVSVYSHVPANLNEFVPARVAPTAADDGIARYAQALRRFAAIEQAN